MVIAILIAVYSLLVWFCSLLVMNFRPSAGGTGLERAKPLVSKAARRGNALREAVHESDLQRIGCVGSACSILLRALPIAGLSLDMLEIRRPARQTGALLIGCLGQGAGD